MAELRLDLSRVDQDIGQDYGEEELQGEEEEEEYTDPLSMDVVSPDDTLSPLEKLDKYFQDEDISKREQAVWCIAEAIQTVNSFSEFQLLLEIAFALANDYEPVIRIGILASIGSLLDRNAELSQLMGGATGEEGGVVDEDGLAMDNEERLLDVPIRMLTDINQQVRRVSQTRIICLLEEEKGNREFLIQQLCPTIIRSLSRDENYDLRIDMALFVSRLASLLGKELILKHFISLFASLGADTMFHVRKAFVVHSKDLCPVLGEDATEEFILPVFLRLCRDEVWGVRKTCADMFTNVSQCCNLGTKHDQLTPAFLKLLHDDSRWVRKAAFQSLGLFISTFYVPDSDNNLFDDSIDPLDDSMLQDNSLLDSASPTITSGTPPQAASTISSEDSDDQNDSKPSALRHPVASPLASASTEGATSTPSGSGAYGQTASSAGSSTDEGREAVGGSVVVELDPLGEHLNSSTPISSHHPNSIVPGLALAAKSGGGSSEGGLDGGESVERQEPKYGCFQFWRSPIPAIYPGEVSGGSEPLVDEVEEDLRKISLGDLEHADSPESTPPPQQSLSQSQQQRVNGDQNSKSREDKISTSSDTTESGEQTVSHGTTKGGAVGEIRSVSAAVRVSPPHLVKKQLRFEEEDSSSSMANHFQQEGQQQTALDDDEKGRDSKTTPSSLAEESGRRTEVVVQDIETPSESNSAAPPSPQSEQQSPKCTTTEKESQSQGDHSINPAPPPPPPPAVPGNSGGEETVGGEDEPATRREPPSAAMEGGSLDQEEGKRKRSFDRGTQLEPNNTHPQVRVFVHSTNGQVLEQDLSYVGHEGSGDPGNVGSGDTVTVGSGDGVTVVGGEEEGGEDSTLHNQTTTKTIPMELTELDVSEPNLLLLTTPPHVEQEVVPDELMELYLSMTDGSKAQSVDIDLPFYCAYSLPGVVLTLGPSHWPLLRPTFDLLASDMQWKIRRVLAYSLHELAKVLGSETTCGDLLPVFEEFCTKDIDDVKIGALSHLAEFFEILPEELRSRRLPPVLKGLQDLENEKNWRYRNMFTEQLILMCDLYECPFLQTHVYPLACGFLEDKVAEVRSTAAQLIGVLLQKLSESSLEKSRSILQELKCYASHKKWLYRLMYVKQCESFLLDGRISCEMFATECLPQLLHMARDKVPNVRISIARMLKDSVLSIDYFQTDGKDTFSLEELQITLECLQHDADRDVKFFAGGEVTEFPRKMVIPRQPAVHRIRSESLHSQSSSEEQYHDAADSFEENLYQEGTELLVTLENSGTETTAAEAKEEEPEIEGGGEGQSTHGEVSVVDSP